MGSTIKKISKKKIRVIKTNSYSNKSSNKSNINKSCKKKRKTLVKKTKKKYNVHIGGGWWSSKSKAEEEEAKRKAGEEARRKAEEEARHKAEEEEVKRKAEEEKCQNKLKKFLIINPLFKQIDEKYIDNNTKENSTFNLNLDISEYSSMYKNLEIIITPYNDKNIKTQYYNYNRSLIKFSINEKEPNNNKLVFELKIYTIYTQPKMNAKFEQPKLKDIINNIKTNIKNVILNKLEKKKIESKNSIHPTSKIERKITTLVSNKNNNYNPIFNIFDRLVEN